MSRPLRICYPGAIYHVCSRGQRREPIYLDDSDRGRWLEELTRTCARTGWRVHAFVLMPNHYHLVLETPRANLCAGMQRLQSRYAQGFNRRHALWGHLLGGRYKAQPIDARPGHGGYLRAACDYVHLNPRRAAGLLRADEPLESYPWSSFPAYLEPALRPGWLSIARLFGEHGIPDPENEAARLQFARQTEARRTVDLPPRAGGVEAPPTTLSPPAGGRNAATDPESARFCLSEEGGSRWPVGGQGFTGVLARRLGRRGQPEERARERQVTDEQLAEQLVAERLRAVGWSEAQLAGSARAHPLKVALARELRRHTPMTRRWIGRRLVIGSASYVSRLTREPGPRP